MTPYRNKYGFPQQGLQHNHTEERGYFYERVKAATLVCLKAVALLFFFLFVFLMLNLSNPN